MKPLSQAVKAAFTRLLGCRHLRAEQQHRLIGRRYAAERLLTEGEAAVDILLQEACSPRGPLQFGAGIRSAVFDWQASVGAAKAAQRLQYELPPERKPAADLTSQEVRALLATHYTLAQKLQEMEAENTKLAASLGATSTQLTVTEGQLREAQERNRSLSAENTRLCRVLTNLLTITEDSDGVAGWRPDGAVAKWEELPEIAIAWAVLCGKEAV